MTFAHTASAVDTGVGIDLCHAVFQTYGVDRTGIDYAAFLTPVTFVLVEQRDHLTNDSDVVQIRFHTVIGTSAHGDFKFVRQLHFPITFIKSVMDFFGNPERIRRPY